MPLRWRINLATHPSLARRVLRWTGIAVGAVLGLAVLVVLGAASYEAIAARSDPERYPAPGRLVDIGGHRLHIHCSGTGSPTVIFDSGLGGTSLDWTLTQPAISKTTRACAYDRAGMGWSDPGPLPRSAKQIAGELHALLMAAGIAPPYVLVGHSLGGKNIRMFARDYPSEVAGMVLVDARNECMDFHTSAAEARDFAKQIKSQSRLYKLAAVLGIPRLFGRSLADAPNLPPDVAAQTILFATRTKTIDATASEGTARADNDVELRDAPSLGDRPVIVLASGVNMAQSADWRASQKIQAGLSRDDRLILAKGSRHYIQWERPGLVITAIREVVEKVRLRSVDPSGLTRARNSG